MQAKAARLSGRKDIQVLVVPDQGIGAQAMTTGLSAIWGESGVPKELRKQLKGLHDQGVTAFVGGNSAAKTAAALSEALTRSQGRSLQGMLIYTNAKMTDELKAAGRGAGVSVMKLDV
ncbi:MAG: hypothetical protein JWO82_3421 [Akkermansiaceae bacterium]|nr:hypothetical protein [Akkermansiaceae bacterium]